MMSTLSAVAASMAGGMSGSKVKYSKLPDSEDGYIHLQFKSPPKVPYKAIALATFLFLIGSLLIVIGALLLAGYIEVTHPDRTVPVLVIGILVFLPGFYHLRIAYYASKGYRGYSFELYSCRPANYVFYIKLKKVKRSGVTFT